MIAVTFMYHENDFADIQGEGSGEVIKEVFTANPALYVMAADQIIVEMNA